MHQHAICIENLTVSYRSHPAVHHLSGCLERGSCTAVVGPNGAGKSSLLAALAGRIAPTTGTVRRSAHCRLAWLPQQAEIDRRFPVTVADMVLLGLWPHLGVWRGASAALRAKATAALQAVQLEGFETRTIGELSVGQFQRVLFARLIAMDADLILLDEPFNGVDARTTLDLIGILRRWRGEGRTLLVVLHDFDLVRAEFPQTLLLARQIIAWGDTATVLTADHLQRSRQMAESWDEAAPYCELPEIKLPA